MLRPGTRVDRYEVLTQIGVGGMSTVYAARHVELGTLHGIKVMSLTSPSLVSRVLQEGRIQAGLRHPNIVPVTDVLRLQGVPALVMELVVGPSLETLILARRLSLEQVDALARGILAGVAAAHEQGRVHRDIKPGNVLLELTHEGVVPRVADFGLAKITGPESMSRSRSGLVMGTPAFMAPEQFRNAKGVGPQADVFSLGALLYQMLTGELPFPGDDMIGIFQAIEAQRFKRPAELVPGLPRAMNDAIVASLAMKPEERPANAGELAALWMELRPEPLQPFSTEEIAGLRSMGVRLPGEVAPLEDQDSGNLFGPFSDQRDLVDLAEGSLWPQSLGGAARTLAPVEEDRAPKEREDLVFPSEPPVSEGRPWVLSAVVACVLVGAGAWILRGELMDSRPQAVEQPQGDPVARAEPEPTAPDGPTRSPEPVPAAEAAPEVQPQAVVPEAVKAERPPERVQERPPEQVQEQPPEALSPPPSEAPVDEPPPEPLGPAPAVVRLKGVDRGYAVSASGEHSKLSALQPGDYTIYAFFEAARATKVMELSLSEGESVSLACQAAMRMCKPE